jgi:hypothetical protein
MVVHGDDSACQSAIASKDLNKNRTKTVHFSLRVKTPHVLEMVALYGPPGLFLMFYPISLLAWWLYKKYESTILCNNILSLVI